MARIKIDEKEYDTDDMSQEAINQLTALQFTAQEIKRVQLNLAALQTAQNAYAGALKNVLEGTADSDDVSVEGLGENIELDS